MIDAIQYAADFVLNIDKHLIEITANYKHWTYLILFAIVFCETGLVVTPFLPGDSLLFAAGAISAIDGSPLSIFILAPMLLAAAFLGDNTNYWTGHFIGERIKQKNYRLINYKYIDKTHSFYEKYGKIALIVARFMPIIRTFAPFVAGIGRMKYHQFLLFSIIGNVLWVAVFTSLGAIFGNIPVVKDNFTIVIAAIVIISLAPPIYAVIKARSSAAKQL